MNLRQRLLQGADRLIAASLVLLVAGTTVAFGGHVWWGPFAIACLALVLGTATMARIVIEGSPRLLKSPLTGLGVLAIGLGVAQLVPMPAGVAARLSPSSHAVYAVGFLPDRARALDPEVELPPPAIVRSPVSIDRAATLRWLAAAAACLVVFWSTSQYTDRLGRLFLVWGCVVGGFLLNTTLAVVQVSCGTRGVYGFLDPGRAPRWAPSLIDLTESPGSTVLRTSGEPVAGHLAMAMAIPERPYLLGSQMGGPAAYLALGAVAFPLTLALTLQLIAPRGSREPLAARLAHSGQTSLVALLTGTLATSAVIIGLLAGPWFSVPFAVAAVLAGFAGAWSSGLRWTGVGLTLLLLAFLACGAAFGELWSASTTYPMVVPRQSVQEAVKVWSESQPIVRDFPWLGTGLGTFSAIYPFYKQQDPAATTAISSLLQWWIESGAVGLTLLALAGLWAVTRVPGALRRVGTADRALAFGLIAAALGFTLFSAVHWTVELASVSIAASAVGGTLNRWLAGGTDLFVERG